MPPRRSRSRSNISQESTPRRSSRRTGSMEPEPSLDIKEPEDEEYQGVEDEDDDEEEDEDDEDDDYSGDDDEERAARRRSKRKNISRLKTTTDEHDENDLDLDDINDEEIEEPEEPEENEENDSKRQKSNSGNSTPMKFGRRGPGRGKKGPMSITPTPQPQEEIDEASLEMENDEYILPEDEEGETKITKLGELKDGRQFRVRTFKVMGKGDRLYMLSTEPARCMGFRDSYLLFQKHKKLYKIVLSSEEKFDLINRDIIPHSYKGRVIGLVTARSIFREFGAKIIVGGRNIIDDYYSKKLKKQGNLIEGELADPQDQIPPKGIPYNINQFVAWHGASSVYHGNTSINHQLNNQNHHGNSNNHHHQSMIPIQESLELKSMKALKATNHINEENWMYQHALSIRDFEKTLLSGRSLLSKGLRDPYTGLQFIPLNTQPGKISFNKLYNKSLHENGDCKKIIYETIIHSGNLIKKTGLSNVPKEIFEGNVNDDVKNAILAQQAYELNQ